MVMNMIKLRYLFLRGLFFSGIGLAGCSAAGPAPGTLDSLPKTAGGCRGGTVSYCDRRDDHRPCGCMARAEVEHLMRSGGGWM